MAQLDQPPGFAERLLASIGDMPAKPTCGSCGHWSRVAFNGELSIALCHGRRSKFFLTYTVEGAGCQAHTGLPIAAD